MASPDTIILLIVDHHAAMGGGGGKTPVPPPLVYAPELRGFPLEFYNGGWAQKCLYYVVKKFAELHSLRYNTATRRTDRRKWQNNIALCVLCMLTRDKNGFC